MGYWLNIKDYVFQLQLLHDSLLQNPMQINCWLSFVTDRPMSDRLPQSCRRRFYPIGGSVALVFTLKRYQCSPVHLERLKMLTDTRWTWCRVFIQELFGKTFLELMETILQVNGFFFLQYVQNQTNFMFSGGNEAHHECNTLRVKLEIQSVIEIF